MSFPSCRRILVFGLDGATFDLIKPWVNQGKLPTLAKLMEGGAWGNLTSTIPPNSPPAWCSFATGLNPGKHGIIDFRERQAGTYETVLINGRQRRGHPIWKILSDYKKLVGVINIPMTYPPDPVNGCFIAGMDTPAGAMDYIYPAGLAAELTTAVGDYIVGLPWTEDLLSKRYDRVWEKISQALEQRIRTVRYLLKTRDFDFFAVNFSATDAIQHHFWQFMDPAHPQYDQEGANQYSHCIYEIYRKLDTYLAEVWAGLDDETLLIVMSDHGFGPVTDKAVYLNNWLEQHRLLKSKNKTGRILLRKRVPEFVKNWIRQVMPRSFDKVRASSSSYFVDWHQTQAYADEYQQIIWINQAGRDPSGIVQPGDETEAVLTYIIKELEALRDPETGLTVIEKVHRREDLYHGSQLDRLPDLYIEQRWDPLYRLRPSYTSLNNAPVRTLTPAEIMSDHLPGGVHRPDGIFLATGPGVKPGKELTGLNLIDLPATILYLFRIPVPRCFDGRVLQEILHTPPPIEYTSEYDDNNDLKDDASSSSYNDGDEEAMLERLRGLGYVE